MAYHTFVSDWIFVIRWTRFEPSDAMGVLEAVAEARRAARRPLIYLSVVAADAPVPSTEERHALDHLVSRLDDYCGAYYIVLEGDNVTRALQRTVVAGAGLFARRPTRVYRSVDDAVLAIADALNVEPPSLRDRLRV